VAFDIYENPPLNTSTDKTTWEEQKLVVDNISRKGSIYVAEIEMSLQTGFS
jgi:hypothetical protein